MNPLSLRVCRTLAALGLAMSGCAAFAQSAALAGIAQSKEANRAQMLLEGARKEGALTIYESMAADDMALLANAFTKKYGIKVKVWRAGSEGVLQKVVTEARAGRFEADVVENNGPEMEALHREKLLQAVDSPLQADLIPEALPAHKEWIGTNIDVYIQAYNTNKVKKEDLPRSFEDLLDPKWKGKLGLEAEDQHWFATLVELLGQEKGSKLFQDIVATNGISVRKGHSLLTNLTASGEVALSLTNYINRPNQMKQKGAPIDSFIIAPAIAQFRGVGVLKNAQHPHAAVLFYDFMLSDGQQLLQQRHYVASSKKIDSPMKEMPIKFIDAGRALDMNEQRLKLYDEIVVRRGK